MSQQYIDEIQRMSAHEYARRVTARGETPENVTALLQAKFIEEASLREERASAVLTEATKRLGWYTLALVVCTVALVIVTLFAR